ncbi:MAG TPA: hypothetical protein VLT33_04655 [Labilithrix sp.]|nr:hypothetical protein [Labilithrix sp.]
MSGALRACGATALAVALLACGGAAAQDLEVGVTPRKGVAAIGDWPPVVAAAEGEALTVETALRSVEGAPIRVRAYLIARTPPCAACNVTGQSEATVKRPEDRIGKTARSRGPEMPGCNQCPPAAATFGDQPATAASPSPASPSLRAVGAAEGLQARHLGHLFLLTGTLRPRGEQGPELDVTDVKAVEGH